MTGLTSAVGVAATPFTKGPYIWDQALSFGGSVSGGMVSGSRTTAVQTSLDGFRLVGAYLNSTATTNTNSCRAMYSRLWISGVGGGGEAARIFTNINGVAASNAHGAHISLSLAASSSLTGEGIAMRGQLELANAALAGGTLAATQAELYADGSSTNYTGTQISLFRAVLGGDGTGVGNLDVAASLLAIDGVTIGSTKIVAISSATSSTHAIRITVNGTPMYLLASTSR